MVKLEWKTMKLESRTAPFWCTKEYELTLIYGKIIFHQGKNKNCKGVACEKAT